MKMAHSFRLSCSPALMPRGPIPYGLAIAAGAAMVMAIHGPNPSGRARLPDLHLSAFPQGR